MCVLFGCLASSSFPGVTSSLILPDSYRVDPDPDLALTNGGDMATTATASNTTSATDGNGNGEMSTRWAYLRTSPPQARARDLANSVRLVDRSPCRLLLANAHCHVRIRFSHCFLPINRSIYQRRPLSYGLPSSSTRGSSGLFSPPATASMRSRSPHLLGSDASTAALATAPLENLVDGMLQIHSTTLQARARSEVTSQVIVGQVWVCAKSSSCVETRLREAEREKEREIMIIMNV